MKNWLVLARIMFWALSLPHSIQGENKSNSFSATGCPFVPSPGLNHRYLRCTHIPAGELQLPNCAQLESREDMHFAVMEIVLPERTNLELSSKLISSRIGAMICDVHFFGSYSLRFEQDVSYDSELPSWINYKTPPGFYSRPPETSEKPGLLFDDYECSWFSEKTVRKPVFVVESIHTIWSPSGLLLHPEPLGECSRTSGSCALSKSQWIVNNPVDVEAYSRKTKQLTYSACGGELLKVEKGYFYWNWLDSNIKAGNFHSLDKTFFIQAPYKDLKRETRCNGEVVTLTIDSLLYRFWIDVPDTETNTPKSMSSMWKTVRNQINIEGGMNELFSRLSVERGLRLKLECMTHKQLVSFALSLLGDGIGSPAATMIQKTPYLFAYVDQFDSLVGCEYISYHRNCFENITKITGSCIYLEELALRLSDLVLVHQWQCEPAPLIPFVEVPWGESHLTVYPNGTVIRKRLGNPLLNTPLPNFLKLGSISYTSRSLNSKSLVITQADYESRVLTALKDVYFWIKSAFQDIEILLSSLLVIFLAVIIWRCNCCFGSKENKTNNTPDPEIQARADRRRVGIRNI